MGLFSSIFGSASSDKADRARQAALDAFNSIKTPELSALQVQLNDYVNAGKLTPEEAEASLLSSNAFNAIATDPSYVGAQKQALQQLQQIGSGGGLTAIDKARMQDITNQLEQQNKSANDATMQQAQQRGVGGSQLTAVNQAINEQGAADRAAQTGTDVAAQAQARALQAMQAAGQTGSQLESQQYGEQANKAQAQNAIDVFNKQALNQTNLYNTQTANAAQGANLANAQAVANANTATQNAGKEYNAAQNQTIYNDALQKAQGIAGVDQNTANQANKAAEDERNASAGLVSGVLQGGATALGGAMAGPVGAVAANSATNETGFNPKTMSTNPYDNTEPSFNQGGEVHDIDEDHPEHREHLSNGGHVHCYAHGGQAFHHPDCYMNKGGFLSGLKKGALHKDLGVPSDSPIPSGKLEKATHSNNETLRKRAQFAENAKHWQHHADGGEIEPDIINSDAKQGFMQGMMGSKQNGPLPIEWDQEGQKWHLKDRNNQDIGAFASYPEAVEFANKVEAQTPVQHDYRGGGPVPGKAPVPGDSPKNDIVDAKLSPGEGVVPRSAMNDDEEFHAFMKKFDPHLKKKEKMATGGMVPEIPRVNDTNPMRDMTRESSANPVPLAATNDVNDFKQLMTKLKPPHVKVAPPKVPLAHQAIHNLTRRPI